MAQVVSNGFLDFGELNFMALGGLPRFGFFNNSDPSIDSNEIPGLIGTYNATDMIAFWAGATNFPNAPVKVAVGGDNFVLNAKNNPTAGTVTGLIMSETVETGPGQTAFNYFAFAGVSVSLVALFNASLTNSMADDRAVLQEMLSRADRITGSAFADFAFGANGDDKIFGNAGNDSLSGDAGDDEIRGGLGNDLLKGASGDDLMLGDGGNDRMLDGSGTDTLTGGSGRDTFVFVLGQIDNDRITDFTDEQDWLAIDMVNPSSDPMDIPAIARAISGGVRLEFDNGDVLTVMGITKAQAADQLLLI